MHRFFSLIITMIFSWQLSANNVRLIKQEIKQVIKLGQEIEFLKKNLNAKNYLSSKVKIPLENRLYFVRGHSFDNEALYISLTCCETDSHIEQKYPIHHISQADNRSLYLDKSLRTSLQLDNEKEFLDLWGIILEIKRLLDLQKLCFKKIFHYQRSYSFPIKYMENKNKQHIRVFKKAKIFFLQNKLKKVFALFKREHSIFNPNRLRQDPNAVFDNLAIDFISLLSEEPILIEYVDLETLTNFLKQIILQSYAKITDPLTDFILSNTRIILKLIKKSTEACGHRIKYLFQKNVFKSKEDIFALLRIESDIMHLAVFVEQIERGTGIEDEPDPNKRESNTFFNFNDTKYICQSHVFLLLTLLKIIHPKDWRQITNKILSENPLNLTERIDFFPAVGRWAQAGCALKGHIKIADKNHITHSSINNLEELKKHNIAFEASFIRAQAEQKAIQLFQSNTSYTTAMKELSPNIKGFDFSFIEILSVICPENLVRFFESHKTNREKRKKKFP